MAAKDWWMHRSFLVIVITPLLLLPLPILVTDQKGLCGYMLLLMAVYWCTESLPIGVTGMIPVFLAPLFGLLSTPEVCENYLKENTMMFTGGIIVAIAIEESFLHKRIALRILLAIGTAPQWLMLGFMLPTWILSMWISNTATTAMMLPIMEAVLEQLKNQPEDDVQSISLDADLESTKIAMSTVNKAYEEDEVDNKISKEADKEKPDSMSNGHLTPSLVNKSKPAVISDSMENLETTSKAVEISFAQKDVPSEGEDPSSFTNFSKGMTLAVAFSASVGGIATLTGTGPNTIMKGHADDIWRERLGTESPVTYATWMVIGMPTAVILFLVVWIWLTFYFCGWRALLCKAARNKNKEMEARNYLEKEYQNLGKMNFTEAASGLTFICLVLLWFFRSPGFIPGWADLSIFKDGYIGDAVPAIFMTVILFCIPRELPTCGGWEDKGKASSLISWPAVHKKFPWSVIFLMGGGFALAESCEVSGLSAWIGEQLAVFGNLNSWLCIFIICLITALLTEVTSNSATCTILMPIVAAMAEELGYNPLFLMFPACLSTSLSFMLPVATPPNAIAFSYGRITVLDMVKAGAILNILCIIPIDLAVNTWVYSYFDMGTIPWQGVDNNRTATTLSPCIA